MSEYVHFKHTYPQPPVVPATSVRGHFMEMARLREQARARQINAPPGYCSARVTRAYTPEEAVQLKGMTADRLRAIAAAGVRGLPLRVRHSDKGPPAGYAIDAEFNPHDQFLYLRSQLNLGDGATGDYVRSEQQKGRLMYMSAQFAVPFDEQADLTTHPPSLSEVSFVDDPHDPEAEVLVSHSSSESAAPKKLIRLCFSLADSMSSATAPSDSAPSEPTTATPGQEKRATSKSAHISAEEMFKLLEETKALRAAVAELPKLQSELDGFRQRHQQALKPRIDDISKFIDSDTSLNDDTRGLVRALIKDASSDHSTSPIIDWLSGLTSSVQKLTEAQQQQQLTTSNLDDLIRQSSASTAHSSASAPPMPGIPAQTMLVSHQASHPRTSGLAARLRQLREEEDRGTPFAKKSKAGPE